ncbi:MAG: TRL domain-containing protein [Bacteroidota bacterium]
MVRFFAVIAMAALLSSSSLTLPVTATSNPVGEKTGTAKATGFLGRFYFDAQKPAENGGITKISTVYGRHTNFLGIIRGYETIVTGE